MIFKLSTSMTILLYSYSLLIHLGMFFWMVCGVTSIARNSLKINWSITKTTAALLGALAALPILWSFFSNYRSEEGLFLLVSNLPALALTSLFDSVSGKLDYLIFLFYPVFGFIGGWGIGQSLEWLGRKQKKVA